jgi:hypothetical protein
MKRKNLEIDKIKEIEHWQEPDENNSRYLGIGTTNG